MTQYADDLVTKRGNADPYADFMRGLRVETDTQLARTSERSVDDVRLSRRLSTAAELVDVIARAGPYQRETLALEAEHLGIDPLQDHEGFIAAHNALLDEVQQEFDKILPGAKQTVLELVGMIYGHRMLSNGKALYDVVRERLESASQLRVEDRLVPTEHARTSTASGMNIPESKAIYITLTDVLRTMKANPDGWTREIGNGNVLHELIHGVFARSIARGSSGARAYVRNGLALLLPEGKHNGVIGVTDHARWLNEALIEHFRYSVSGERPAHYLLELAVLETLNQLSPGLCDELFVAAIDPEGPSAALGKVEALLGPNVTGIEDVAAHLAQFQTINFETDGMPDLETLRERVLGVFPVELRPKAGAAYDRMERWILPYREVRLTMQMREYIIQAYPSHQEKLQSSDQSIVH